MHARSDLEFRIATAGWELDLVHRLNHQTFTDEIPQHRPAASGRLVDRFHEQNEYAVCLRGQELAGMVAIRGARPFSLEQKLHDLDAYLPSGRSICELRLLAVERRFRATAVLSELLAFVWGHCLSRGYDLAVISGITRQLRLYRHLGFVPFGPLVGTAHAQFQPMMLTLESFAGRARDLFGAVPVRVEESRANLLPGPVAVSAAVREAFAREPESHRSDRFVGELERVRRLLCLLTGAGQVQVMLGSGTLANDAVAGQLSLEGTPGLILTNGEFGERLIDHARRFGLAFEVVSCPWGRPVDLAGIDLRLRNARAPRWLWCVHSETATGVLNDLPALAMRCRDAGVRLCVDAVSSLGTVPVRLEGVFLASGVSGKGLRSFPGVALVFHNHDIHPSPVLPRYLDLGSYAGARGVPFTQSSNLLGALHAALEGVDWGHRHEELRRRSSWLRERLLRLGFEIVAPAPHASPAVVTIALPATLDSAALARKLEAAGYLLSAHSEYLRRRNWIQICLMGGPSREELSAAVSALYRLCVQRRDH